MSILETQVLKIPETLIKMRQDLQWSKTDLAKALSVTPLQICRWEKSKYSTISFRRLLEVISVLESAVLNKQLKED